MENTEQKYFTDLEWELMERIQSHGIISAIQSRLNIEKLNMKSQNPDFAENEKYISAMANTKTKLFLQDLNRKLHSLAGQIIKPVGKE